MHQKLTDLGMRCADLPWQEILACCEKMHIRGDLAQKRLDVLLQLMARKITSIKNDSPNDKTFIERIIKTKFLPVRKKPADFPLHWKGEESGEYTSCEDGFLSREQNLVCCSFSVIDEYTVFRQ